MVHPQQLSVPAGPSQRPYTPASLGRSRFNGRKLGRQPPPPRLTLTLTLSKVLDMVCNVRGAGRGCYAAIVRVSTEPGRVAMGAVCVSHGMKRGPTSNRTHKYQVSYSSRVNISSCSVVSGRAICFFSARVPP